MSISVATPESARPAAGAAAPADPARRGRVLVAAMAVSAFGPYLFSGVRIEQITVYGTFAVLVLGFWWMRATPGRHGAAVMALLVLQLTVAVIGAVDPPQNTTRYQGGDVLAGIDNLALPIAILAIVWMLHAAGGDRRALITLVCRVTVWVMIGNAGLAAWATIGSGPDLAVFQSAGTEQSVAFRAEQMGRFSGIFNQPAEAGLMYSVALLAAIYLYRQRAVLLAATGIALSLGGVLTVSKVFLLVGLPAALWQVLRSAGGQGRRMAALVAGALIAWGVLRSGVAPRWTGAKYLSRLLPGGDQDPLALYTAGRFASGSGLAQVAEAVRGSSPVWGFGAGGLGAAYDNAWIEALAINGIAGAALLTGIVVVLAHAWWSTRRTIGEAESRLAGGLVAVLVGAAMGVPSLTANRCATIVWLLLALLLLTGRGPPR